MFSTLKKLLLLGVASAVVNPTPPVDPPSGVTVDFIGLFDSESDLTTYTANGVAVGTAAYLVIAIFGQPTAGSGQGSSVTVDGVAATRYVPINGDQSRIVELFHITGTDSSVDISATFTVAEARGAIGVWAVRNTVNTAPAAQAAAQMTQKTTTPILDTIPTLNNTNGGVLLTVFINSNNSMTAPLTWSQTGTTDIDELLGTSASTRIGAHRTSVAGTGLRDSPEQAGTSLTWRGTTIRLE